MFNTLLDKNRDGSNASGIIDGSLGTNAATCEANPSNDWPVGSCIRPFRDTMPHSPDIRRFHTEGTEHPNGVTSPSPVTTTRLAD